MSTSPYENIGCRYTELVLNIPENGTFYNKSCLEAYRRAAMQMAAAGMSDDDILELLSNIHSTVTWEVLLIDAADKN